jgi:hypothetical protein
MKKLSPAEKKELEKKFQRLERDVKEFIECNPSDAAQWPDPFEGFLEYYQKQIKRKKDDCRSPKAI